MLVRRLAWGAGAVVVLAFAIEGGEYGTSDLLAQRETKAQLEADLEALRDSVTTLNATLKQVSSDDAALERIARERYGMVRSEKELLYRFDGGDAVSSRAAAGDSGVRDSLPR